MDFSRRRLFTRQPASSDSVTLPWVASPGTFTDDCTRCGRCVGVCESRIIEKSGGGFPAVNFSIDECTFCYACAEICPEPIFLPRDQTPWQAKAMISQECLAGKQVECRSCSDSCETSAIKFRLQAGRVAQPEINFDDCNGCGACVSVCPVSAIRVSNNHNNER